MESIYYTELDSPIGTFHVGITEKGICMFEFPVLSRVEQHKRVFSERFKITEQRPQVLTEALEDQMWEDGTTMNVTRSTSADNLAQDEHPALSHKIWTRRRRANHNDDDDQNE